MSKNDNTADGSESKSDRTRARILDAAARVLSTNGFAGTRLADVATQAQVRAPTIYYYFSSREDLIEEVMFCGVSDMRRHLQHKLDELPSDTTAITKLMTAIDSHLRHELQLSDYTTASIRNSGQIPEHLRSRQRTEEAAYGRIWKQLFNDAVGEGTIRADVDPRTTRLLLIGALNWAAEWWDPDRDSLDHIVETTQTLIKVGLAPVGLADAAP